MGLTNLPEERDAEEVNAEVVTNQVSNVGDQESVDHELQTIEDFVQSLILTDENDSQGTPEPAFIFLQQFVENDIATSSTEAEDMTAALDDDTLSAIIQLLSNRLPVQKRKKFPSKSGMQKEIKKWLQCSNAKREFMLYTTQSLKDMVSERKIKVRGSKTIDRMIDVLAASLGSETTNVEAIVANLSPSGAAIRAILQRSFLPHQKGAAREACSMGHALERPILEKWAAVEVPKRGYPIRGLQVNGAYTAGLVAKLDCPWVKDSIDFIVTTFLPTGHEMWGVEVKARVNPKTAAEEEEFIYNTREKHVNIEAGDTYKMIQSVGERFQVLHHSYVYDFDKSVFIVGDSQSEILQSAVITFNNELKKHYGVVLKELKDLALSWAYKENISLPLIIPEEILEIARTLPQIKDDQAIEGSANLWLSLISQSLPMPSFVRLIPAVCAYWNAVKSGSDTTTKLMDDRILYPPHVNSETIASTRLLVLSHVIIHRITQILTAKEDLDVYPSLAHFRNAASHRTTFHKTLLTIHSILKKKSEEIGSVDEQIELNDTTSRSVNNTSRVLPSRQRIHGVIPEAAQFGVKLPFQTPKKIKKKVEKGEVSASICGMYNNCTGRLVQIVEESKKQRCTMCGKTTSYYCCGCKSWFCFAQRMTKKNKDQFDLKLLHHVVRGERLIFFSSCYSQKHQLAWVEEDSKTSATVLTP